MKVKKMIIKFGDWAEEEYEFEVKDDATEEEIQDEAKELFLGLINSVCSFKLIKEE